MKTRTIFSLVVLFFLIPGNSEAQVGNLLKNKLNKVVNAGTKTVDKEINKEIDTAVEKGVLDARDKAAVRAEENQNADGLPVTPGESGTHGSQGEQGFNFGKMMGNKVDLKYDDSYNFSSRLYMVTETYDKKDVIKMDFFMYYSSSNPSIGIETKSITSDESGTAPLTSSMVMDGQNKCFIILTDINGMKMGMISDISGEAADQADSKKGKADAPPSFTKTGNTKIIAGYKCDEYSYSDPDDKTTGKVWFTKDAKLKIDKNGWKNTGMSAYYGNPEFNEGIILANEAYDAKGNLVARSETKEINENFPHTISITGYTLRQMNMGQGNKK